MSLFSKIKNVFDPHYEPLVCKPADIFELFRECVEFDALLCRLVVEINGKQHKIGVTSDYNSRTGEFFDIAFYLDDSEFPTLEALINNAEIDGFRVAEFKTITVLEDEDSGDPRNNVLLADREIK